MTCQAIRSLTNAADARSRCATEIASSRASLANLHRRGIRPGAILMADTGNEKPETCAFLPVMNGWLVSAGFPELMLVRYKPKTAPCATH